jgi:hypothetical protein
VISEGEDILDQMHIKPSIISLTARCIEGSNMTKDQLVNAIKEYLASICEGFYCD